MEEPEVLRLIWEVLHVQPLRAERMTLTHSGNVIYSVEIPDRHVIVRTRDTAGAFEHTEHNLAALRPLGLPVPRVLAADTSRTKCRDAYIILEKIPGRDLLYELPSMTPLQRTRLAEQIVAFQRKVATLPQGTGFGWGAIGQGGTESSWPAVCLPQEDRQQVPWDRAAENLWERLDRQVTLFEPYLRSVRPICFLEDLTTKNVLLQDGELQGVIDFDSVCFGDPLWMIGLTDACIVNDVGRSRVELFYIDELCRCWGLTQVQKHVVAFYAALRARCFAGESVLNKDEERTRRLLEAADHWLNTLEQKGNGLISLSVSP